MGQLGNWTATDHIFTLSATYNDTMPKHTPEEKNHNVESTQSFQQHHEFKLLFISAKAYLNRMSLLISDRSVTFLVSVENTILNF